MSSVNDKLIDSIKNAYKLKSPFNPIKLIISKKTSGFDINYRTDDGETALTTALEKYDDDEKLYKKICELLIKNGVDVNKPNGYGTTPLMIAVECGADEICKMLLNAGADINTQDPYGKTAIIRAIENKLMITHKLLLEYKPTKNKISISF